MTLAEMEDPFYVDGLEPDLLVPHYLVHCYLYYQVGRGLIRDDVFDALAARLADEWEDVEHPHKDLIDPAGLSSGGHYIKHTERTRQAALWLLDGSPDPDRWDEDPEGVL
jgi:hypothetical protein